MKKNIIIIFAIIIVVVIGIITTFVLVNNRENSNEESSNNTTSNQENNNQTDEGEIEVVQGNKIRLTIGEEEIIVTLDDTEISKQFQSMLPMTLSFEDYNNTEKIAYLENELDTTTSPDGYTPAIGDFAYYAPWGNISIFYKEFRYSSSLIKLGTIDSGIDVIQNMDDDTNIVIENIN